MLETHKKRKGMLKREKNKKTEYHAGKILVDTYEVQEILCSGRAAAVNIATVAGARVQTGRRVFWNVKKIQHYIDAISE